MNRRSRTLPNTCPASRTSFRPAELVGLAIRWMLRMAPVLILSLAPLRADPTAADTGNTGKDAAATDKSGYNLFNPTPAKAMREFSPDRPDETESPCTVDAGHYQFEASFAELTLDRRDGARTTAWNVAPFNLRVGLLNNLEFDLIYDSYLTVRSEDPAGRVTKQSGVGDITLRFSYNLWGNDGGNTALGLIPYVKIPTNTDHLGNNGVEGGLLLPFTFKLPGDFDASIETAAASMRNDDDSGYHAEFVNAISVDHAIIGKLSAYLEFFSDVSTERGSTWVGTVDTGLEFLVTENIQIDCGCNFGVTRAAADFNPFAGITVRF